jgi:hypothetical protein
MSERKEKEVKERKGDNEIDIDDIKNIFFKSIGLNQTALNKAWNGSSEFPVNVKEIVERDLNFYKINKFNKESTLLMSLKTIYKIFINQFTFHSKSKTSDKTLYALWEKYVEPRLKELLEGKKEEFYKGEQLKSYVINILKEVNNDYSKLVRFLIENNYINLENKKVILYIFTNPNLNIEVLLQLSRYWIGQDELSGYLNDNLGITVKDIKKHQAEIKWRYDLLSRNPNMTWEFIKETMESKEYEETKFKWMFDVELSKNPNITLDIVMKNEQLDWNYADLGENPNITPKIVKETDTINWDYNTLAKNPNFKWKDLQEYFDDETELIKYYSQNPNLNIKDILSNLDFWIDWLDDEENNETKIWENVSKNPGISIQDIVDHPELNWNIESMELNPNLTFKTIIENWNLRFDSNNLLQNKFNGFFKKDIEFPKFYWFVNNLYNILPRDKDQKEMYHNAQILFDEIIGSVNYIIEYNEVIKSIVDYNVYKKEYHLYGIIKDQLISLLETVTKKNFNSKYVNVKISLNKELGENIIERFIYLYLVYGGYEITEKKLDKKECGVDIEYFTQKNLQGRDEAFEKEEDKREFDVNELISFELNGKVMCLKRSQLIAFWNSEPDEDGDYISWNWGDCKFHPDGRPYEDTCKRFFKIPLQTYISEKTRNKIEQEANVNYWKLEKEKVVRMGKNLHRISEYNNPNEQIYKVVLVIKKKN